MSQTQARCWWCGAAADSREHKYKKSELTRNFGPGPWVGKDAVVRSSGGTELEAVQGPNAKSMKFQSTMCQRCNNAASQPFDRAYDRFLNYMELHIKEIAEKRQFRFSDIYGADWPQERTNLIKYWVKHICSRIAETKVDIPDRVIEFLNGEMKGAPPHMCFDLFVHADFLRLTMHAGAPYGSFITNMHSYTSDGSDKITALSGEVGRGWVWLAYWIDLVNPVVAMSFEEDLVQMGFVSLVSTEYTTDPSDLYASGIMTENEWLGLEGS